MSYQKQLYPFKIVLFFVSKTAVMTNEKLAQGAKELRKEKNFSQEELAKLSGLSLRTIQRIEKGETTPTGETLKRLSNVLEVSPHELLEWNTSNDILIKTIQTKYDFLHIFKDKLVLSSTAEIDDLVADYGKSVNNVFKTLMVFFISIPISSVMAVIFYTIDRYGLAFNSGAFSFCFLVIAFKTLLFTSGATLIKKDHITKIKLIRSLSKNVLVISHKESGRIKERGIVLEKNQVATVKNVLLSEGLIEEKNIHLNNKTIILRMALSTLMILGAFYLVYTMGIKEMMFYYGAIFLSLSIIELVKITVKLTQPIRSKKTSIKYGV